MLQRILAVLVSVLLLTGCGTTPTPTPTATPPAETKAGAAEPATKAWPRQVRDADNKMVEIKEKPQRIHTLSLGYDEITMRLVGPERFAAIGSVATSPVFSNIIPQANKVAVKVGRKSEDVIAAKPDLVLASPFANKDLVRQLKDTGLTVVVSNLQDSVDGHAENIRFLAHMFGEEEQGEALIREVETRLQRIHAVVGKKPAAEQPRVIRLTDKLNTGGKDTSIDGIIRRAGGINVAAEAGIERWQQITLEKVVELKPDVILVADGSSDKQGFGKELLSHPSLQSVPAVRNQRVYSLPDRFLSTLSHWNVRGVEELAKLLWPEDFKDVTFADFQ